MKINYYQILIVFICDLLSIPIPEVIFLYKKKVVNLSEESIDFDISPFSNVKGKYLLNDNILFINIDEHKDGEELISIIHELRHCCQWHEISADDPIEDKKILENGCITLKIIKIVLLISMKINLLN